MAPWQALRARGALRTVRDRALGPGRVDGQALASGYSLGPLDGAYDGRDGPVRAFSLGGDNQNTMQDLNGRLASYMDKVQALEAANGTLEMQIAELLDRKSPDDLIKLDRYLDIVNTLHSQITEYQTAEAQTKLQLVSLVLVASDLSGRLDAEQGQCGQLQTNLMDLSLVGEQLCSSTLPGLTDLLGSLAQELSELQAQHLQDVQCLRARAAGDISMQLDCAESPQLSHQLEMFRNGSVDAMLNQNRAQNSHWFNSQVATLPREEEETSLTSSSDALQTEVNNLRMTRLMLEEELNQMQTQHMMLEENDIRQMEGYSMQLTQLQHRADGLGQHLHSIQQATCEQAEEFLALLHIKCGLDKELEDYAALLDLRRDRTLISSHQTMTSAIPLNIQTSGTAFQRTAMMEADRRIVAQTRTLGSGSEFKARESHPRMFTPNQARPVDLTSALHISESTSTQTSILSNQATLARNAPKKYPTSATSVTTSGLLDRSSTSSENKIQIVTNEIKGTLTASKEGESKTGKDKTSIDMKQCSAVREVQSPQTVTKNSVIIEPKVVQEITGQQVTKQVTSTTTEIIVENTFLLQATTKAAQPETHTVLAAESQLKTAHADPPQLSSTSCDMQTRGIKANVCQINSVVLEASIPADNIHAEIVGGSTVVDLKVAEAQRVTSIERQTEEDVGNHTSLTIQGNTTDVCQKSQSVEITAVGNHLETIQESTDGDAVGQAQSSLDEARVSTLVDMKVRMEGDTTSKGSSEDTPCLVGGTVVSLQASMVTQVEDSRSKVGGNAEGRGQCSSMETKADVSGVPLIGGTPITVISENNPIPTITDECPIIEKKEDSVKMNTGVPQEQSIAIVETVVHFEEVEKSLSTHALMENKMAEQEEEERMEIQVDTMLNATDSPLPDLPKTIQQGKPVNDNVEVVSSNLDCDATVVVEVNQTDQGTSAIVIETESVVSSVDEVVSCEAVTEVTISQTHPETSLSPENTDICLSPDATEEFSSTTTPEVSEVQCVTTRDSDSLLTQVDSSQDELGPVDTNETLNQNNLEACMIDTEVMIQKELDTCFSPADGDGMTPNEMDTCFSPDDTDAVTNKELEMCFSPLDNTNGETLRPNKSETPLRPVEPVWSPEGLQLCLSPVDQDQHELEACMSPVDNDILSPNQDETCFSPADNNDILSPNQNETCFSPVDNNDILSPNRNETCFSPDDNNEIQTQSELEGCFSPVDNDIMSPNGLEACFSPVDNDLLSPNGLEGCLSPDTQTLHDVNRGLCFSPSDNVRESPSPICSPVSRYNLSTKVDNQSLSFSGNLGLTEKNKAYKVSEPPKEQNRFTKAQSSGYISKTVAVSRDVENSREGQFRNRSIGGTGLEEAFSPVGSPPDNRYRRLSLGDKDDKRFHSITRGTWGVSSNKSLERTSPGSSLTGEPSHCFRSVPLTRGASFSSSSGTVEGAKGPVESTAVVKTSRATSPGGRLFSAGSGEWKVYAGGTSRTSNGGSASGGSVGSGGKLAGSGSGDRISRAVSSYAQSSSRRYGSTGSGESKTVYGSTSGRISGAVRQGSVPGGNRAPSPATGRKLGSSTGGSGGRLSSAYGGGGGRMSSASSGGKHSLSGSSDRLSGSQALMRISSTPGHVRTNSTGGRVISSSDRPAISAGSGVGANKERISVCKRAALSISAAGRERSQEKNRSGQRNPSANNPRIQHWVTTGIGGAVEGLDDQDDILNL